jgi:ATP-dependent protease ClpP protease subunit
LRPLQQWGGRYHVMEAALARDEAKPRVPKAIQDALPAPADIMLTGEVNDQMVTAFLDQLEKAQGKDGDIVICCTTPGGDAEMVRRIELEIERLREAHKDHVYFLGKSVVYSAGVTIMAAFPVSHRYLTKDTVLLIHGRQLTKTVELDGPIRHSRPQIKSLLHQFDVGIKLEEAGFRKLIDGSDCKLEECIEKGSHNWYLTAEEALEMRLVRALV